MKTLKQALLKSWKKDTCYSPMKKDWSPKNPAYGQCYCTVLVVNDYFGGKILKYKFDDGTGHYSNYIHGKEVDLTRCQFDKDQTFPKPKIFSRKELETKYGKHNRRYKILKKRAEEFLKILT